MDGRWRRCFEDSFAQSTRIDKQCPKNCLGKKPTGALGDLPESYRGSKIIPTLEAILIETLEPRQNRKRGDDLSAVEYIQKEDSEIQKKKVKQTMEAALNKL